MTQNMNLKQRTKNALERIADIEQQFNKLIQGLNDAFEQINRKMTTIEDSVEAVVTILGVDVVAQSITDIRIKRAEAMAKQQQEEIKSLVDAGVYLKTDTVTEKSVIVGKEVNSEGEVIPPGWMKADFRDVKPDLKEKLLGQSVGFKIETGNASTFEIVELYEAQDLSKLAESQELRGEGTPPVANPGEGMTTTVGPLVP